MEIDGIFFETFKIQRIFFRYIRETELESLKITPERLAKELEFFGLIKLSEDGKRYAEMPLFLKFTYSRDFKKLYEKPNGLLHNFVQGLKTLRIP